MTLRGNIERMMHLEEACLVLRKALRRKGMFKRDAILEFSEAINTIRLAGSLGQPGAQDLLDFVAANLDCAGEC